MDPDYKIPDPSLSFRIEGSNRRVHNRDLYTKEEITASLQFAQEHPEAVLAILAYRTVVEDYLGNLSNAFVEMSKEAGTSVTPSALEDFTRYAKLWNTNNFVDELIPALAIFKRLRVESEPKESSVTSIDQELFSQAVEFIIANNAFRNWVTVPANVAASGKKRSAHFVCPAVGTVREQLLDGTLLSTIHIIITDQVRAENKHVLGHLATIRRKANEKAMTKRQPSPQLGESDLYRLMMVATIPINGVDHRVQLTDDVLGAMHGEPLPDDIPLEWAQGAHLKFVISEALVVSLGAGRAVWFNFSGNNFRITPELVRETLGIE